LTLELNSPRLPLRVKFLLVFAELPVKVRIQRDPTRPRPQFILQEPLEELGIEPFTLAAMEPVPKLDIGTPEALAA
jgi:hypothetical protein